MVHGGTLKLRKADVEQLLADYDSDPVAALTVALRVVLDRPDDEWSTLIQTAFAEDRRDRLHARDSIALDQLAAELNELRTLAAS